MIGAIANHKKPLGARPLGRMLLAGFMAWALFLQAFATQTHIHEESPYSASQAAVVGHADHHKAPTRDDSAKCPICQQVWRAGQFIAPSWLAPLLLVRSISRIEITVLESSWFSAISHTWRSRGPPLR